MSFFLEQSFYTFVPNNGKGEETIFHITCLLTVFSDIFLYVNGKDYICC